MDAAFEQLIENEIRQLRKNAHGMRAANKLVAVSGSRLTLPLNGRTIEIVYYPARFEDGALVNEKAPLIIGFHGGGFVMGGCALDDAMWMEVTKALQVNVASIGYRMSPEATWQETFADAYEAALYLASHAQDYGFDEAHLSVMGQSAGGNLAAVVAMKAQEDHSIQLDNMVLLYPFLDVHTEPNTKGEGSLVGPICYAMNRLHCPYEDTLNPYVSPVFAPQEMLLGLPNAIVNFCEDDNLKHEAMKFAAHLQEANVPTHTRLSPNMPHGYFESGFKEPKAFEVSHFLGEKGEAIVKDGSLFAEAKATLQFIKEYFIK